MPAVLTPAEYPRFPDLRPIGKRGISQFPIPADSESALSRESGIPSPVCRPNRESGERELVISGPPPQCPSDRRLCSLLSLRWAELIEALLFKLVPNAGGETLGKAAVEVHPHRDRCRAAELSPSRPSKLDHGSTGMMAGRAPLSVIRIATVQALTETTVTSTVLESTFID